MAKFYRRKTNRPVPRLEPRIAGLSIIMMVVLAIVGGPLYYLQVIKSPELSELADRNRIRIRRVAAPRGLVYDRRHRPLVDTHPSFNAVLVPEDSDNITQTIEHLEKLLGQDGVADKLTAAEDAGR